MLQNPECAEYLQSEQFKTDFNTLLAHDRETFDKPEGWNTMEIEQSPLLSDFSNLWSNLKDTYLKELPAIAFSEIPKEEVVAKPATNASQVIMINTLQKDLYYIQIGSFVKKENALKICNEIRQKGFQSVVFEDKDGVFKVLIEGNSKMEETLAQLKTQVTSGAFVKKRIGK